MKKILTLTSKNYAKGILVFTVLYLIQIGLVACQSESDGGPLGPTNLTTLAANITVSPAVLTLAKNGAQTFTATGGSGTFTWSVDNQSLGSIVSDSGVFTAGNSTGSVIVTATDFNGSSGTATVTISSKSLTLSPSTLSIGKQGLQDFTVLGDATVPVFFSIENATLGSFAATATNVSTFTAGITTGTAAITATDADGDSITGSVTIVANTVTLTPGSVSLAAVGAQAFTATGANANLTFTFTLSGETNSYTGASITAQVNTGTATVTVATLPSADEGNQTLTLTVTDSNGDTGTAQITIIASDA